MSTETLKAVITGDASGIDKASAQAAAALKKVSQSAAEWDKKARELNLQTNYTSRAFTGLSTSAAKAAPAVAKSSKALTTLATGSGRANFALVSLSQGISDIPFGFAAIANNIQQTINAFTLVQQESGGVKGALKSIGTALKGPTGIFLAFSVVTAAIEYFTRQSAKAKEETDHFKDRLNQLNKSIKDGADAIQKGSDNAENQTATLKLLYDAATDTTRGMNERLIAAQKLQAVFPKTFSNLTQEAIVSGKAAGAYRSLATSILQAAQAEANRQTIIENDKTIHKAQKDLDKMQGKYGELVAAVDAAKAKVKDYQDAIKNGGGTALAGAGAGGQGLLTKLLGDKEAAQAALDAFINKQNQLKKVKSDLTTENNKLAGSTKIADLSLDALGVTAAKTGADVKTISEVMAEVQAKFEAVDNKTKAFGLSIEQIGTSKIKILSTAIDEIAGISGPGAVAQMKELSAQVDKIRSASFLPTIGGQVGAKLPGIITPRVPTTAAGTSSGGAVSNPDKLGKEKAKDFDPLLYNLNQIGVLSDKVFSEMNDKIKGSAGSAGLLANSFESIFSTIAQGGNPFQAMVQGIEQLIIKLIAVTAAIEVINLIPGGPAVLKVLDVASSVPRFAGGGFIPGPQLAVVGDAPGGEWVLNQRQVSAILQGAGSGKNIQITGELKLRGNELRAALKRANDANNTVN